MPEFPCPYLGHEVELTTERENHIAQRHPDLLPAHRDKLAAVLHDPDQIRRSPRFPNARLFSRLFGSVGVEQHVIVVVVSDPAPSQRHWIVTAYRARKLAEGEAEWRRI